MMNKKSFLSVVLAVTLMITCIFLTTACGISGNSENSASVNSENGSSSSGGNGANTTEDAFDRAVAINGEGVSLLGKTVEIASAGSMLLKRKYPRRTMVGRCLP